MQCVHRLYHQSRFTSKHCPALRELRFIDDDVGGDVTILTHIVYDATQILLLVRVEHMARQELREAADSHFAVNAYLCSDEGGNIVATYHVML